MADLSPARWLAHLERHVPIALDGRDPEGIHQVRVAGRRLRVLLELGGHRALVSDLRWLVQGLGRARDLDVLQTVLPAPEGDGGHGAFIDWVRELEAHARADARDTLTSARVEGLLAALRALPPVAEAKARKRVLRFSKRVRDQLDALVGSQLVPPVDPAAGDGEVVRRVHRLRRALRRLRYAREALGDDATALKQLQEALGALCDLVALERVLREFSDARGVDASGPRARLDAALARMTAALWATPAALHAAG